MSDEVLKTQPDEVIEKTEVADTAVVKTEVTETNKAVEDTLKSITDVLGNLDAKITKKFDEIDSKIKSLEPMNSLELKPKDSDSEDIGAKVKAPDEYQSNSIQAGIREASPGNAPKGDKGGLSMQSKTAQVSPVTKSNEETINVSKENTFTTETPRGGSTESVLDSIIKSVREDYSPLLKMAREVGHEELFRVADEIKKGTFYTPSRQELEEQLAW
jgi:hypothetical protein